MSAWTWGSSDAVRIVVTTVGADGSMRRWYSALRAGHDHAETIRLPVGTQHVRIERPRRVRVDLGSLRGRR